MSHVIYFLHSLVNPLALISTVGLVGIFLVIFAESGLFFGFFLPGDSLLFSAGLLASQGYFNIALLLIGCIVCAIVGDNVGYLFGKKIGLKIFTWENSFIFKKKYVEDAHHFYKKHGKKTILFARFIPIIRTFAPIVAGVANMEYKTFLIWNSVGGILWCSVLILLGFFLGNSIPNVDDYIIPIVLSIIFISTVPVVLRMLLPYNKE